MASPHATPLNNVAASTNRTSLSPRTPIVKHRAPIGVVLDVVDLISDDEDDVKTFTTDQKIKQPEVTSSAVKPATATNTASLPTKPMPSTSSTTNGSAGTKPEKIEAVEKEETGEILPNVKDVSAPSDFQNNLESFTNQVKLEIPVDLIPSTSKGISDNDSADYEFEDEDGDVEEMEEEEEQDENGIPLSAIARLSDLEKEKLKTLTEVNSALNAKIAELERHISDSDEENIELNAQLSEYTAKSEKILDAMIKLCKLDDDSYDEPDMTDLPSFRFSNSGHKYLDKALTVLVQACLEEEYGKSKNSTNSKKRQSMIKNFKDLSPNKISSVISAIAKRESGGKPGTRLLHRQTKRPIVAQEVLENLHQTLRKFRSKIFNQTVIPKYSINGERNPKLPDDPELLARLNQQGGKLLSECIRDFAGEFEETKRQLGLAVDRDANDDCVEDPSHADSESENGGEEEDDEDTGESNEVTENESDNKTMDPQTATHEPCEIAENGAGTNIAEPVLASPSEDLHTDDEDDDEGFDAMELLENIDVD